MTNHPVHFLTQEGKMSPSAFIPFCEFGGNMLSMGIKIDQFNVPVCNSFHSKVFNGQLCYEADLSKFSRKYDSDMETKLDMGLAFLLDYNEDRKVALEAPTSLLLNSVQRTLVNLLNVGLLFRRRNLDFRRGEQAMIYLNTIGKVDTYST